MKTSPRILLAATAALLLAACSAETGDRGLAGHCQSSIAAAESALSRAKASGLGSSLRWGKAASLIGAAKVQEQFGEYQNCVNKTTRAQQQLGSIPPGK